MNKNDALNLIIRDVTLDGDGVGQPADPDKGDGRVVFCFGARETSPGETVGATIIKTSKNYVVAKLNEKITSPCGVYPRCGGCSLLHFSYGETLSLKEKNVKNCFKRIGGISAEFESILPSAKQYGYRNKTIYRFSDENGKIKSGFFRRLSHDVVPCDGCLMENEISLKIRGAFVSLAEKYKLTVYNETTGKGFLRGLMVRASLSGKNAQTVIIGAFAKLPTGFAEELCSLAPEISSLFLNVNNVPTNTLLGDRFIHLSGEKVLVDRIGPASFEISPQSFFQVNPYQTEKLYAKAYEYADLRDGDRLLDLFCGIGTIGQYFAKRAEKDNVSLASLTGIEYTPEAVENARKNAGINDVNCPFEYCAGDAGKVLAGMQVNPNVAVVDPPRKGMDINAIEALAALPELEKIVYISCGPATLARDLKLLEERGFKTVKACPCDMFPFAGHVECVVLMSRVYK